MTDLSLRILRALSTGGDMTAAAIAATVGDSRERVSSALNMLTQPVRWRSGGTWPRRVERTWERRRYLYRITDEGRRALAAVDAPKDGTPPLPLEGT
ncbi:MAG TPA: hypothetical protein VLT47_11225 [Anaeromyxobacteraceae bacterium]|nr:hypothetical protein [Anaeromyxobacteraceae bacterium]